MPHFIRTKTKLQKKIKTKSKPKKLKHVDDNVYLQNAWFMKTIQPAPIHLCIQYYLDADMQRQAELDFCVAQHLKNTYIEKLIVIKSQEILWPQKFEHQKVTLVLMEGRPSFQKMIEVLNSTPDAVHILANSDICFDNSLASVQYLDKDVLALNRWELQIPFNLSSAIPPTHADAYDVWIWKGSLKIIPETNTFTTGVFGCDNRFCFLLHQTGYRLCNPWPLVRVYHIHNSKIHRYSHAYRIPGPYAFVRTTLSHPPLAKPIPLKPLCILLNCFFNVNDVKRTVESIERTGLPCDIIFLENPSKYSPDMHKLAQEKRIHQHYICSDNIEGNIWELFLSNHPEISTQYRYIALSEADVVLDKDALHEITTLLDASGSNVGNASVDLHLDTEKYKTLPIRAWVPVPEQKAGYSVGASGFQFIVFKPAFLMEFITAIRQKQLSCSIALGSSHFYGISDSNLQEFNRRKGTLWIRTVKAKLDHIGWEHYLTYDEYCAEKDKNLKAGKIRQTINVDKYTLTRL